MDVYKDYIEIVTQKTYDKLKIELNKYSQEILDKYKDKPLINGKALPTLSNQKMNTYLKEIAKLLKFNTPIKTVYFKSYK